MALYLVDGVIGGRSLGRGLLLLALGFLCLLAPVTSATAADPAEPLYQPARIDVIELSLDPTEKAKLEATPDAYVKGTFALAETQGTPSTIGPFSALQAVEVKLKGDASFRNLSGKAAFKLKFPKEGPFLGLRKMTLNNMVEDPSMTHETLAYTAFRAAGVPASRTSFAYVYLNGTDYGIHLDIETLDSVSLPKIFGSFDKKTQHLYEGESGADVRPGGAADFEIDEGEASRADLEALIAAVNSTGSAPWSTRVAAAADLAEMTRMWAVEKYVGQRDGYASGESPFQPNNYYLYSDPTGRFQMLPWGTDETWQERNHLAFGSGHGLLFAHCLEDTACTAAYRESVAATCGAIAGIDLDGLATATASRLAPWQQLEQDNDVHEYSLSEIQEGVAETRAFVSSRRADAAAFLGTPCASVDPPVTPPTGSHSEPPSSTPTPGTESPGTETDVFRVGKVGLEGGLLRSAVHVPTAGVVSQRITISTADGELAVGRARADVAGSGDFALTCHLSKELRRRLRARWLALRVVTEFERGAASEAITRRVALRRLER